MKGISDGIATIVVEGDGRIGTATVVVKTAQKLQNPYFEQSVYNMKMGDKRQLEVSTLPEKCLDFRIWLEIQQSEGGRS